MYKYFNNIRRILKTIDNPLKKSDNVSEKDKLEREFYDKEAEKYLQNFDEDLFRYYENEPLPPRHKFFYSLLEDVKGKYILDCCCGYGFTSVKLAKGGALITGIDISPGMIELAKKNAEFNNISKSINFKVMSVQDMSFEDNTFDYVVSLVGLHHLNLEMAGREIRRVLKPGGKAIFLEPRIPFRWIMAFRSLIPKPCDESPGGGSLSDKEVHEFSHNFSTHKICYFQSLSKLLKIPFLNRFSSGIYKLDLLLINKIPASRKLCWAFVLEFTK
jgi:ubiquinone/menaquinone biosynthesis C-methylase UbiE